MSGNHIYTQEFISLSRELSRRGVRRPGDEAMKIMGAEKAVKRRYHDYYIERKLEKR